MFHHIILNSLFPTGARAISPETLSFQCDSKILRSPEQSKGRLCSKPKEPARLDVAHAVGMTLLG